jgi:signal transduction histidine kinase
VFGKNLPISRKLTRMNMAVSGAALLIACAGFVTYDVVSFRRNFQNYLSSQARIVEANSVTALLFDDPDSARRTLGALASSGNIRSATILTPEGRTFATFTRDATASAPPPRPPGVSPFPQEIFSFDRGEFAVQRTILLEDKPVGYVYIRASPQALYDRLTRYLGISAVVLAICLGAALVVSWIFGRAVADPIQHLAEVASTVSREKNYAMRAEAATSHDEVSVLINAFNEMLAQIQERDLALQQARDQLEARVQARTAELKVLSGRLMKLQDEERRHIARELHDSTGQVVAALGMNLAVLQGDPNLGSHGSKALAQSVEMVKELSRELRTLSHLLHPPLLDVAGLESALKWYVQGFAERSGVHAEVELSQNLGRLPRELETAVFRIVQESLTNVHRHAQSATARVRVLRNGSSGIRVEVRDQGKGIPGEPGDSPATLGIGIQGMRERVAQLGGRFEIQSDSNGTVVVAVFPG